jgi:hypothetical protein
MRQKFVQLQKVNTSKTGQHHWAKATNPGHFLNTSDEAAGGGCPDVLNATSAILPKADMVRQISLVRFVP